MARYLDSLAAEARRRLPDEVYRYFSQGAGAGVSAAEAEAAWSRLRFRPRVLRDVTRVDTSTTLLGTDVRSPFAIAPTTLQRAAHPDGELATARAAKAAGSLMVVSSNAGTAFEAIGETGVPWWLQMYVTADRAATIPVVDRAVAAGARALVLTADTPVVAKKVDGARTVWEVVDPAWLRVNFAGPAAAGAVPDEITPDEKATDLGPQDIAWLADRWGVPVVVKGLLHPADVRRCVDAGASAVWVSNHGGRQLDRAVSTARALPAVAEAVRQTGAGMVEVYVDGGVRRGSDALAAATLGARAVFLGRPVLYGLAADGSSGVERLLAELTQELEEALRLAGAPRFEDAPGDLLDAPDTTTDDS